MTEKDKSFQLMQEDLYDESDVSTYELYDYAEEPVLSDEDDENDIPAEPVKAKRGRRKKSEDDDRVINLYNAHIAVDSPEESIARYTRIAHTMNHGTWEERKAAGEEACLHMKGLVKSFMAKYRNYIQRDPSFADDLMNEAYANIIKYAGNYDSHRGAPSTFFYFYINSAVSGLTTRMKHNIGFSDATLKKKILALREEYREKYGRELTDTDIIIETDETLSKVSSVLQMMNRDMNTHLEAITDYGEFIPGNPEHNRSYESPEAIAMQNITHNEVMKIMLSKFPEKDIQLFIDCKVNGMSYQEAAKLSGTMNEDAVRRKVESMQRSFYYDPNIRKHGQGYIREERKGVSNIVIYDTEGTNDVMDALEEIVI